MNQLVFYFHWGMTASVPLHTMRQGDVIAAKETFELQKIYSLGL